MSDIHFFNLNPAGGNLLKMCQSLGALPAYRSLGNGTTQILCVEDAAAMVAFEVDTKQLELALGLGLGLGIPFVTFMIVCGFPWLCRCLKARRARQRAQRLIIQAVAPAEDDAVAERPQGPDAV